MRNKMTSPLRRAQCRTSELHVVHGRATPENTPDSRGVLFSGRARKSGAIIDYTIRENQPNSPKASARQKGSRSYVIVPGYGGIKVVYGDFRDAISAVSDDPAVSYRHPRTEIGLHGLRPDKLLHPDKLGKQAVVAMIDVMRERYPDRKVTLIGHSMGGPNAVEGALRRLNDVEDIVLVGSGGLEEGQNLGRLAKRMPGILMQEGRSILGMPWENMLSTAGQAAFHFARNPLRTIGEGIDIANRDLMVEELNVFRTRNIGIHAVQLEHDGFFFTDIARQDTRGLVDSFTIIPGLDHVGPQTDPMIVAEHIMNVFSLKPAFEMEPLVLAS